MEREEQNAPHESGPSEERSSPESAVKVASELTRSQLQRLVAEIQGRLYLDLDADGTEYWNPEKEWNCADLCQDIGNLLDGFGLVPAEAQPLSSPAKDIASLEELATSHGVVPEDLDEPVHDCASADASDVNNGGLVSQLEFLVEHFSEAQVRTMLREIVESKSREGRGR